MTIYFIADLHLNPSARARTDLFLHFLKHIAQEAEALYILGDFFEYWLGDDIQSELSTEVIHALQQYNQAQSRTYFLPGNRDFLVGEKFLQAAGCRALADPSIVELYGKKILLLHGDSLCTQDKNYQRYRAMVRHPWIKKLFGSLPIKKRLTIAEKLRAKSQLRNQTMDTMLGDTSETAVANCFRDNDVALMIHGHTHRPGIHRYKTHDHWNTRYVLCDWVQKAHALCVTKEGEWKLETYGDGGGD